MTPEDFDAVVERRLALTRGVLVEKAKEYASAGDRLHNFKSDVGGLDTVEHPTEVLWGYLRKHLQSVYDMVSEAATGGRPSDRKIDEKIGDAVNYLILLEALLRE